MHTVIIGSKQWCDEWAEFYWNKAIRLANRNKYPNDVIDAMHSMFLSYMWEDTEPWH